MGGLGKMKKMTAKEYLSQVGVLNSKINHKLKQLDDLKILATCTGGGGNDGVRVQTSARGDKLASAVGNYVDLERDIEHDVASYVAFKGKIIAEIYDIEAGDNTKLFIDILMMRYIEFKRLEEIAVKTNLSYDYIRHQHGYALMAFQKQYLTQDSTQ